MRVLTEYEARLARAPREVVDFVLASHGEMRANQLTDVDFFDGNEQLIFARNGSVAQRPVIGALMWDAQEDGSWWTQLGYVDPQYRGLGVYQLLWERVVQRAIELRVRRIQGGTAWGNDRMRRLMEQLGRRPAHVLYDFLPGKDKLPKRSLRAK